MADKIMETATQLQKELSNTPQFEGLKQAYSNLKADTKGFDLFKDFQEVQLNLQKKQMAGTEPTDDELKHAHDLATQLEKVPAITELMTKEQAVNQLLGQINQVVTEPISELYRN